MLIRIVKMEFQPEKVEEFQKHFKKISNTIRNFEGNRLVELYRDTHNPNLFFTYSYWETPEHLEHYRESEFFKATWAEVKPWFAEKAIAWSVTKQ